jgi:hypothetical protein
MYSVSDVTENAAAVGFTPGTNPMIVAATPVL